MVTAMPATVTKEKLARLSALKATGEKIAALTAYDYPTGRILDEQGVDLILVGDSVGMVVLGFEDTTSVTMEMMVHHIAACARGVKNALLAGDFPYQSYETPAQALENGRRLLDAGAEAVKLEGGTSQIAKIEALIGAGIPVIGHIGMLPQRVREEGGYKKKGKTTEDAGRLLQSARDLETAGVSAIVLEGIVARVAAGITEECAVPTIGIGSGPDCDGQILVVHDLLGSFPWFQPPFATPKAELAVETSEAVRAFVGELKSPPLQR